MREMVIDVFAGAGGASLGIERALGIPVDLAINHDVEAMAMHWLNHPFTRHDSADVWSVNPRKSIGDRHVGLAWFSPDCTHFSKAKGGKPCKKHIRSLAWVVVRWAKAVRPRVIILENVQEFQDWGPLDRNGQPIKDRKGETYKIWFEQLRRLGYVIESSILKACDYGAPTIRKRLFVVARCDGRPIVWPEPTHGPGRLPYRTAAECIDWSLPCPSIFLSPEEAKALGVHRPLAKKTLERIARGIRKFVIETGNPFIIKFRRGATGQSIAEPMHTITAGSFVKRPAGAGHAMGLVVPFLHNMTHGGRLESIDDPLRTITTDHRGEKALIAPVLVNYHGAKGDEARGQSVVDPLRTQDTSNRFGLAAATLIQTGYGEREGQAPRVPGLDKPLGTVVGTGKHAVVTAHLMTNTTGHTGSAADAPMPTLTTGDHQYAVATFLSKLYGTTIGSDMRTPLPTITGQGNHIAEVRAFLMQYNGTSTGQACTDPLHTCMGRDRFGLVTVEGLDYVIEDIGMRMLTPRELARAQGFSDQYHLTGTKSNQVEKLGNSVCPPLAEVLVRANVQLRDAALTEVGA